VLLLIFNEIDVLDSYSAYSVSLDKIVSSKSWVPEGVFSDI